MRAVAVVVSAAPQLLAEVAGDALGLEVFGVVGRWVLHHVQVSLARLVLLRGEVVPVKTGIKYEQVLFLIIYFFGNTGADGDECLLSR